MIRPKNLNMEKIEKLFNDNFIFNKNDLNKGVTAWVLTPRRDNKINVSIDKKKG